MTDGRTDTHRRIGRAHGVVHSTSSSAVAKRPRVALCLSVFSLASVVQYLERSFLLVTSASDLPVRMQFDSVLLSSAYGNVEPCCHVSYTRFAVDRDCV